jgi:hypothetical protein
MHSSWSNQLYWSGLISIKLPFQQTSYQLCGFKRATGGRKVIQSNYKIDLSL